MEYFDISKINFTQTSTESDVEQKFIFPFLIGDLPTGLGINQNNILTKANINKLSIDKGSSSKLYYPDYIVSHLGFPVLIIEAKKPSDSDLQDAYREARLYANELNAKYSNAINPVTYVIATNGIEIYVGYNNQDKPDLICTVKNLSVGSAELEKLLNIININNFSKIIDSITTKIYKTDFYNKPNRTIGGKSVQEEEIQKNPLGEIITNQYNWVFNPDKIEERKFIVRNGYIKTKANERNSNELDKLVKLANSASDNVATLIQDTSKPTEILNIISEKSYRELVLLIGKVGSGKSTFIDYLQYTDVLNENLKRKTIWIRLDLNKAPIDKSKIYTWIQTNLINNLEMQFESELDFEDLDTLLKIYSVEVNRFKRGTGKLLIENSIEYNKALFDEINKVQNNIDSKVRCYIRHLINERNKSLILVLDNCDKKDRESQLLMFEVAEWAKEEFKSLIVLPLRDETFDNYKNTKPLDTAIKEYCFRIETPNFQKILTRRVQLAIEQIEKNLTHKNKKEFQLRNSMNVTFSPENESSTYLLSILNSVLEHDNTIRRLLTGLSGGNIRIALEMFLKFCSSGHIPNEEIIKIRTSKENYTMPTHIAIRALMRGDRKFYQSKFSYIKNIIDSNQTNNGEIIYFSRLAILRWLKIQVSSTRSTRKGYFQLYEIFETLEPFGFHKDILFSETQYLIEAGCILTEDFRRDNISDQTLIKIAPAGYAHLNLMEENITYISTIAEDTWFTNQNLVNLIKQYMSEKTISNDVDNNQAEKIYEKAYFDTFNIAVHLIDYLLDYSKTMIDRISAYNEKNILSELITLEPSLNMLNSLNRKYMEWIGFCKKYKENDIFTGEVINITQDLIFIKLISDKFENIFTENFTGIIKNDGNLINLEKYQKIKVELVNINRNKFNKMQLKFLDSLN